MKVIIVNTPGPQGPQGPIGPTPENAISASYALTASYAENASVNTGSLVTTASFNAFTSSYNTGSFSGSFYGDLIGTASLSEQIIIIPHNHEYTAEFKPLVNLNNPILTETGSSSVSQIDGLIYNSYKNYLYFNKVTGYNSDIGGNFTRYPQFVIGDWDDYPNYYGQLLVLGNTFTQTLYVVNNTIKFIDALPTSSEDTSSYTELSSLSFISGSLKLASGSFEGDYIGTSLNITGSAYITNPNNLTTESVLTVIGTGSNYPVFRVLGSQGNLLTVNDNLSGSLFSVNNISGLSFFEVFSNGDIVFGDYNSPAMLTTSGLAITGSVTADNFTGSLFGTASWAQKAITASYLDNYIPPFPYTGNAQITGSLTITENLTVLGSSSVTYITSSQLDVGTNIISVNVAEPGLRFGGLVVYDSGSLSHQATASLFWDSLNNHWVYQNASGSTYSGGGLISGPKNFGALGSETYPTLNRIVKGEGGDHITDSNISDNGSIVSINSNTEVTGSLIVSSPSTTQLQVGSNLLFVSSSGNVGIGTNTPAYKLDVNGNAIIRSDTIVRGSASSGGTSNFEVQNNGGGSQFIVRADGYVRFNTLSPFGSALNIVDGVSLAMFGGGPLTSTQTKLSISHLFQNSTNSNTFTVIGASPTINQTGAASGITRGLLVNPTLTSAVNWRSIEWNNNVGFGIYGSGSAPNVLLGNTTIGSLTTGSSTFNVVGSTTLSGSLTVTGSLSIVSSSGATRLNVAETGRITIGRDSTVTAQTASVITTNVTNGSIVLAPNGTGAIIADIPDGTAAGGNARGDYAVDLQMVRGIGAQSATGVSSTIVGGQYNQASGNSSVAGGGGNFAEGGSSTAIGGSENYAFNTYSTVCGGYKARAPMYGQNSYACGAFASPSDAQHSKIIYRRSITGQTIRELFLDGTSARAFLALGSPGPTQARVWNARIDLVAVVDTVGAGTVTLNDVFSGNYNCAIKRVSNTTSMVGSVVTVSELSDTSMETSIVTLDADDTNEALRIQFTPPTTAASDTVIRVVATVYLTEVGR